MARPVVITRQTLANSAANRWREQYARFQIPDAKSIGNELAALGPTPNPDDVDRVVGNKAWTIVPPCNGCGAENPHAVVHVGDEPNYESHTATLCTDCISELAELIQPLRM